MAHRPEVCELGSLLKVPTTGERGDDCVALPVV
ncbi:MAG: hypothetical protein ACJAYU_002929 [Bradymonadia bacterium]|jgi:hypothetical protein